MPQGPPERPGWQVRISPAVPGPDGVLVEAGVPSGGGVWVGGRWVLTCAHVVGPEPGTVMVRFSFAGGEPVPAAVAPQGWLAEQHGDLALLALDRDPPPAARPAPLRPARAVTGHACAAYGYPRGLDDGVWYEPKITGQTVDRLQLTARDAHGHQIERGFSGTGLFDTETGAVVGLAATRDRGKDVLGGFAIPLQAVVAAFPQLGPWAGWRLGTDPHLRQHWRPRARGVYQDTTPGWYFTGRTALLRELTGWLEDGSPGRAVRLVTGPAGTGKSAVLAWLCALSDPQLRAEIATARPAAFADAAAVPAAGRVKAAVWARGLDARDAAESLAAALTLPVAIGVAVEDVLAAVGEIDQAERSGLVVVLDALDEARAPRDIARQLLVPLARDLGVKVLAGTRPGREEELLAPFGERAVIYRLDDPVWFDRHDLADYAAACLRADFDPDLASGYRTDPGACGQVAAAIAEAAGSNFLVAGLAARTRADEPVIDVSASGWRDRQRFPAEVGQAFDDYLTRFGDNETRARDLLRAVAYAEGTGLPADELWAGMATALAAPRRYGTDDLAWLLDSAAGYLVESGGDYGSPVHRIFHQALVEHLRPQEKETQRQRQIVEALMQAVPPGAAGPEWDHAPSYIRRHLAAHAAAADLLDDLLEDPLYLITVDPARLVPHLDAARSAPARAAAAVVLRAGNRVAPLPPQRRARLLMLTAAHLGHTRIQQQLAAAREDGLTPRWAHTLGVAHQELTGHTDRVISVALGRIGGREVIVSGSWDRTVRIWDPGTGEQLGDPLTGHTRGVNAVSLGQIGGREVIVSGGDDGTVRIWEPGTGTQLSPPLTGRSGSMRAVALGQVGKQEVIAYGSYDGTVRIWDPGTGEQLGDPLTGHTRGVNAVSLGQIGGREMIVSGGDDRTIRIWDPGTHQQLGAPLTGHTGPVSTVALGHAGGREVIVSGSWDSTIRIWDPGTGEQLGDPLTGHSRPVRAVGLGQLGGREVIVSGGDDRTIRIWDPGTHQQLGAPLTGHTGPVSTVALGHAGGREAIVSGSWDSTVRIWDPDTGAQLDAPPASPASRAYSVALGNAGGREVIVSGGDDGAVRIWDPGSGAQLGAPLTGHTGRVRATAIGRSGGQEVIVSGGDDGTVRIWDPGSGAQLGAPLTGHTGRVRAVAIGRIGEREVIVSGGDDYAVRIWDPGSGAQLGAPLTGHTSWVSAVALGCTGGREVIVSGSWDSTVRIWDPSIGEQLGVRLTGHAGPVYAVALGRVGGQEVIVSGGDDHMVRIWDPGTGEQLGTPLTGHTSWVNAVVVGPIGGREVIVSGGDDYAVRIWNAERQTTIELDLLAPAEALAIGPNGLLCLVTGHAICLFA